MATQRYISTSFWDDAWIRSLDPSEKFIYLYLMTNPLTTIAGIYQITVARICFDTGYNPDTVNGVLNRFAEAGKAFFLYEEWVVIPTWPKHQRWEKSPKIKQGIDSILAELPEKVLKSLQKIGYRYPLDTLSIPYRYPSNYSDSDSDSDLNSDSDTETDTVKKQEPVDNSEPEGHNGSSSSAAEIRKQLQKIPLDITLSRHQVTVVSRSLGQHGLPPEFLHFVGNEIRGKPLKNPGGYFWKVVTNLDEHEELLDKFRSWSPPVEKIPPPNTCPTCGKPFSRMTVDRAECSFCGLFDYDAKTSSWVSDDF